jgi:hypothetical protein
MVVIMARYPFGSDCFLHQGRKAARRVMGISLSKAKAGPAWKFDAGSR